MPFAAETITLTTEEREELEQMTQSRTLPAGDVFRARLILLLADGVSYRTIQERLDTTAPTISRWKERFLQQRMGGLVEIRHPGQKPTVLTPALQAKVLEATRRKPKDGSTHWSCRKLAAQLGVSKDTVQRVWHRAGLKPHRLERYMASEDPDFERKAADVIGLYLNPPQHAAVFCVDEKTAIQALIVWTRCCRCLLVAPSATGSSIIAMARYRSTLRSTPRPDGSMGKRRLATPVPSSFSSSRVWLGGCAGHESHVVLDNLSAHKTLAVEKF